MNGIRHVLTLANAITSAALVAGFLALIAVVHGNLTQAAVWVAVAAIFDSVDGAAARRNGGDNSLGTNLDSLADLVSFGVVPAIGLYLGPLYPLSVVGLAVSVCFLLAGAWRLARFPLVKRCDYFVGLPIPVAGVLLMATLLWQPGLGLCFALTLALSALMVSTLPFPTLPAVRQRTKALLDDRSRRSHR